MSRRAILEAAGAIATPPTAPTIVNAETHPAAPATVPPQESRITYIFFNAEEAAFIEAAVSRLIPTDKTWPGALEAAVPNYIDKQLAGAWGAGEQFYRKGPWQPGTPSQGYQLPHTPAELFHAAIAAINKDLKQSGTPFVAMNADAQDAYLRRLEAGETNLGGVPSNVFFGHLRQATIEGFFADPVYGGNRDMIGWRMIGFPGVKASYYDVVDLHGVTICWQPMSLAGGTLAENVHGHIHEEPATPALPP